MEEDEAEGEGICLVQLNRASQILDVEESQ